MSSATSNNADVATVLGTMTFGWKFSSEECGEEVCREMMEVFLEAGHTQVDTAFAYSGGETEKIMGRIFAKHPSLLDTMHIATKANPWPGGNMTSSAGLGGLKPESLVEQVEGSTASLAPGKVDLLYLHAPDGDTPIEVTLESVQKLYEQGSFKELGLSNFAAWEVTYIHGYCKAKGWVVPSVYQGMYNAITRNCEAELVPCLKKLGMRYLVYNPLAGGLLTGKHSRDENVKGRFDDNKMYRDRFWNDAYFDAVEGIRAACDVAGVPMAEAALRWLYRHSQLDAAKGDGVIVGASSTAQLRANLGAAKGDDLPKGVLDAIEAGWEMCKKESPPYCRGHSKIE